MKAHFATEVPPPESAASARPQLRRGLYLVLTAPRDGYERLTAWAVAAGVSAVQLRAKGEPVKSLGK